MGEGRVQGYVHANSIGKGWWTADVRCYVVPSHVGKRWTARGASYVRAESRSNGGWTNEGVLLCKCRFTWDWGTAEGVRA